MSDTETNESYESYESITSCADRIGISAGVLYRHIRDGRLTPYVFAGTSIKRLKVSEVDALFVPQAA